MYESDWQLVIVSRDKFERTTHTQKKKHNLIFINNHISDKNKEKNQIIQNYLYIFWNQLIKATNPRARVEKGKSWIKIKIILYIKIFQQNFTPTWSNDLFASCKRNFVTGKHCPFKQFYQDLLHSSKNCFNSSTSFLII